MLHNSTSLETDSNQEREKGFMLSFKPSFGRPHDHQGWSTIDDSLSKGDVYAISAASINEQLMRIRRPHREVSPDDF